MHPAGVCTKQLTIEHKRQPGQRVPVGRAAGGKSPDDAILGQAVQNVRIFVYVEIIIIIDKIEIADLPEDQQGTQCQNRVNENDEKFLHKFGPNLS